MQTKITFHWNVHSFRLQTEKRDAPETDIDNRPPDPKRLKTEFCSDNSVSLPGILPGSSGPGMSSFEPGMFKHDDESSSHSRGKSKDKEKSSDGASKVIFQSFWYQLKMTKFSLDICWFFVQIHRRKRRKRKRSTNISISTSIKQTVKIRRKRRRRKKIPIFRVF